MERNTVYASLPWDDGSGGSAHDQDSELAGAIVMQAVKDYMKVLQNLWKKDVPLKKRRQLVIEKTELEQFFYSNEYQILTDLDPDVLLSGCRERAFELAKEKIQRQNRKKLKKMQKEMEDEHNETGKGITGSTYGTEAAE